MGGNFSIKVSDILLHSGAKDTITFAHIFSTKLEWLTKDWITTTIRLENLNKSEILITLETIELTINTVCDRCGCDFMYEQYIEDCAIQAKIQDANTSNKSEDLLSIDPKDLCVDVEDFIIDQIHLVSPIKILCSFCQKKDDEISTHDEEIETTWSIKWM